MVQSAPTRSSGLDALRSTAQAFARDEMRPVALKYDESEEYPADVLRRAAELGLTCYDLPAEYGGGGVESLRDRCEVIEELAWGDSPIFWVVAQGGFFAGPLLALGSEEQKRRWLPPLCGTEPPACAVAITEPEHGSDAAAIETTAVPATAATSSTGARSSSATATSPTSASSSRPSSPAAARAASARFSSRRTTTASSADRGCRRWAVAVSPRRRSRSRTASSPSDRRLGAEGAGFRGLMWVFDVARVQLAAGAVGLGRAALELAVEYAKTREAFGRAIHEYQAVSFRLADAKLKLDQARLMTHRAAELSDAGEPFSTEAAMAKLAASEAAVFATSAAVMTLGGAGYIRDSLAQKWYRDAKLDEIWDGTSDIMRLVIARSLFA